MQQPAQYYSSFQTNRAVLAVDSGGACRSDMLRLFSRVARHPSSLKTLGDSFVGPRCSYGLQALGFSSGPSQPDGPPEKKQEGEQPATEGGKKEQAAADAGKNPQLQRYLESLVQLKGGRTFALSNKLGCTYCDAPHLVLSRHHKGQEGDSRAGAESVVAAAHSWIC